MRGVQDGTSYHRVDRFSGSITVSDKIRTECSPSEKDIIIARHKADIEKNHKDMNTYLIDNKFPSITIDDYNNLLKTGILPKSLTDKGVTLDKNPVIAQVRAMINGRSCLNGGDAIGNPTLKFLIPGKEAQYTTQSVTSTSSEYASGGVSTRVSTDTTSLTAAVGWV